MSFFSNLCIAIISWTDYTDGFCDVILNTVLLYYNFITACRSPSYAVFDYVHIFLFFILPLDKGDCG